MHQIPDGGNMFYKKISSQYRMISKKGEGTFSEVLKAQCLKTNKYVAIKCMKNTFDNLEQVTNLREIQALQRLSPHVNVVKLIEVLYDQPTGKLALVFELMDMNIYELIRNRRTYVSEERIKCYMYQLIKAMDHLHRNGIFHRDIKPENILIMDEILKLADFGSCRGVYSKQPYTEYISTRWYRAPECLLTDGYYTYKMDMWGVGCVFFEILSLFPLFPGNNELDQIQRIHKVLGTPPPQLLEKMRRRSRHADFSFPPQDGTGIARLIPHASPACIEIINKLLAYNPDDRWSARQALRHIYFKELRDRDKLQQALMNSGGSRSLRPSPRMCLQDFVCKSRASDVGKQTLAERTNAYGDPSTASSPVSMTSGVSHLPSLGSCFKFKECDKVSPRSTPVSQIDETLSPIGSSLSMYASPDCANSYRDMDETNIIDAPAALPPIKGIVSHPTVSTKVPFGQSSSNVTNVPRPLRVQPSKNTKNVKGTKNHRNLPELSPKGSQKPGEPPPYKKRANNPKYVSPYSQRSMGQSPSIY